MWHRHFLLRNLLPCQTKVIACGVHEPWIYSEKCSEISQSWDGVRDVLASLVELVSGLVKPHSYLTSRDPSLLAADARLGAQLASRYRGALPA